MGKKTRNAGKGSRGKNKRHFPAGGEKR